MTPLAVGAGASPPFPTASSYEGMEAHGEGLPGWEGPGVGGYGTAWPAAGRSLRVQVPAEAVACFGRGPGSGGEERAAFALIRGLQDLRRCYMPVAGRNCGRSDSL